MVNKLSDFLQKCLAGALGSALCVYAHAAASVHDTADPMYLESMGDFLSESGMSFGNDMLRVSQKVSYGFSDRFSLSADIKYQQNFNGVEDGFSNIGLGGIYRLSGGDESSKVVSDILAGINFGGNGRVRSPDFADTIYYAGMRIGRVWSRFTLAGTVKTSWIFDEIRGMAYIDFIPEIYARITEDWKAGLGFNLRKSTNPDFDREWADFRLVRQYGRTQYIGYVDYEFEFDECRVGARLNILF
ncbi:MAG: hypothetical protein LBD50_00205 [Rickettsiales bacterium]|nr:hypothetical protein [Rickettsiales bacterium]